MTKGRKRTEPAAKKAANPASPKQTTPPAAFAIVGIGASAGGLEALELFLNAVPTNSRQAFVVVQHLDPTRSGMLAELLQRRCALPVVQITNGMVVEPGHVYVIPPDRDLSILNSVLHTMEPSAPRGQRLPIDFFFSALAADRREGAIGVILSGMGSDGTAGIKAIKANGGGVFVQSIESAQFDSMPKSAIATRLPNAVDQPENLYAAIREFLRHFPASGRVAMTHQTADMDDQGEFDDANEFADGSLAVHPAITGSPDSIDKVILLVRTQTGHDFSHYKRSTLTRRIARRMSVHHLTAMEDYIRLLQSTPKESDLLFNDLLIGVTQFFRDPKAWEELARVAIPHLLKLHPDGGTLRAWVPGCSTGEEAFSLAIVFREVVAQLKTQPDVEYTLQIFATDLGKESIATARAATYPVTIAGDVSPDRLRRFFVPDDRGFRLTKVIREMVVFAPQNVVMDPPFTRLDLISCRNLLIYLTPELQRKLLPLFHYSLLPDGVLFLGTAETVGTDANIFGPLAEKARIYRRLDAPDAPRHLRFPSGFSRHAAASSAEETATSSATTDLRTAVERVLMQRFAQSAVLVDADAKVSLALGDARYYIGLATGAVKTDRVALPTTMLGAAVLRGLADAVREQRTVTLDEIVVSADPDAGRTRITITPMNPASEADSSYLIVFADVTSAGGEAVGPKSLTDRLMRELDARSQELERARQDTQTSQQELSSTNEELQSANEELTTSKEEMQSMNEELQTVNHELQAKVDELTLASNDMKNLLNSTSIATLFLDSTLAVRRFTTPTTSIIRLIPGDVGRPITDIVNSLNFPELAEVSREVLRTLVVFEREVSTNDGRWFVVRVMPYRTHDDQIDGLVLTFTDATKAKTLEAALRKAQLAIEGKLADKTAELDATISPPKEKP